MKSYPITKKLAYEAGVHIGDGNLYSKKGTHKITYSGNLQNEELYYLNVLRPLIQEIYNINPVIIKDESNNSILLIINSKQIAEFKITKLKLPNGKKTHIQIPDVIQNDKKLLIECIKGIGDTDFSLSFKKNRKGIYNEPRIELFQRSTELTVQLHESLVSLNFTASIEKNVLRRGYKENRLRMYGKRNLELWMEKIGFLNPYRLVKYHVWKKYGQVMPYQSYNDLVKLLNSR